MVDNKFIKSLDISCNRWFIVGQWQNAASKLVVEREVDDDDVEEAGVDGDVRAALPLHIPGHLIWLLGPQDITGTVELSEE